MAMRLQSPPGGSETYLADANSIAANMPELLVTAERAAATLSQGLHGRRTAGRGEAFWQYRRFADGDSPSEIDWRRSARSDHHYIRENEWEAAHTVWFWVDLSSSMHISSNRALHTKIEQAILTALSSGFLLVNAGERVGAYGSERPPGQTRQNVENLANAFLDMAFLPDSRTASLPPDPVNIKPYSDIVLLSDFLAPIEDIEAQLRSISAEGLRGHLVQVLDPAEENLPFKGRVEFVSPEDEGTITINRSEKIRDTYRMKLLEHRSRMIQFTRQLGWSFAIHHTDAAPAQAVLQLHNALAPERK